MTRPPPPPTKYGPAPMQAAPARPERPAAVPPPPTRFGPPPVQAKTGVPQAVVPPPPTRFGSNAAQAMLSTQSSQAPRISVKKQERLEKQKAREEKKSQKQDKKHQERLLLLLEQKKKEQEECMRTTTFTVGFWDHVSRGEVSGNTHTGYHTTQVVALEAFGECEISGVPDGNAVYKANCTKAGRTVAKESTFFPDAWNRATIEDNVKYAYCNQSNAVDKKGAGWCGRTRDGQFYIAGFGNPISTAYPSYQGEFD